MAELRDYQSPLVDEVLEIIKGAPAGAPSHVLLQTPTGGGKTEMAGAVAEAMLGSDVCVVWLTHRRELRQQLDRRFTAAGIAVMDLASTPPAERRLRPGTVSIVSPTMRGAATLSALGRAPGLAHRGRGAPHAGRDLGAARAGLAGARARPDGDALAPGLAAGLHRLLSASSCRARSTSDLVRAGWLVQPRIETAAVVRGGRIQGGEYAAADVDARVLSTPQVVELWYGAVGDPSPPTVWYVPTREGAYQLSETLAASGIEAAVLLGASSSHERARDLGRFASGSLGHLVNVDVLGEGVDVPRIGCVVLARPTRSLTWWLQAGGAGAPAGGGKREAVILDLTGSVADAENREAWAGAGEGGPGWTPFDRRRWSLQARGDRGRGAEPEAACVSVYCTASIHPSLHRCPHCGSPQYVLCRLCSRLVRLTGVHESGACADCFEIERAELTTRPA